MRKLTDEQKRVIQETESYIVECGVSMVKPVMAELARRLDKSPQALQKHFSFIKKKTNIDLRDKFK